MSSPRQPLTSRPVVSYHNSIPTEQYRPQGRWSIFLSGLAVLGFMIMALALLSHTALPESIASLVAVSAPGIRQPSVARGTATGPHKFSMPVPRASKNLETSNPTIAKSNVHSDTPPVVRSAASSSTGSQNLEPLTIQIPNDTPIQNLIPFQWAVATLSVSMGVLVYFLTGAASSGFKPQTYRYACMAVSASEDEGKIVGDGEGGSLSQTSFGTIGSGVGLSLLIYGFSSYFLGAPGESLAALLCIYGFILTLLGFAFKYAELKPVEQITYSGAIPLRDTSATPIQNQIRNDVTRFRYGDEQHLDDALVRTFRIGKAGGIRRQQTPRLTAILERVVNGQYALVLRFDSPKVDLDVWEGVQEKMASFFGPGIAATVYATKENLEEDEMQQFDQWLISDGTAAGKMDEDYDVLPPLQPGNPPRIVRRKKEEEKEEKKEEV